MAASGTDGEDYCYSVPDMPLYVLYPDEEVVNSIVELANIVEEGGSLESWRGVELILIIKNA